MSDDTPIDSESPQQIDTLAPNQFPPPTLQMQFEAEQQTSDESTQRPRRRGALFGVMVLAAIFGVIGGVAGTYIAQDANLVDLQKKQTVTQITSAPVVVADGEEITDSIIAQVATRLANSVVTITSTISDETGGGRGVGTGVVLTSDGEILTNAHVVEDASEVVVRFAGETEPRVAKVLASDLGNDLALLKIDATGLTAATFANPGSVRIGDTVIAIGYALALDGGPTVTSGIISALKRTIETESGALNSLIQTDAAISSGNSGGPLVNLKGEVVGINTAVARGDSESAANNIGFSISVEEVLVVIEQLRAQANGVKRQEGFLGVGLTGREDGGQGAIITNVQADSPADMAGILIDDIVLSVDGEPIDGQLGLVASIRDAVPGQVVKIEVSRAGKRMIFEVTLIARSS
ncbi:MAG: trypsin-like peptidase domain-containing protein [Actinomycetota bacterium]|nr:trypsin-like peptidase domain-containing protein [Actinomycetota bacterium]